MAKTGHFKHKNGGETGRFSSSPFVLDFSAFLAFLPQLWHVIAHRPTQCDMAKTGKIWGKTTPNGEKTGKVLSVNSNQSDSGLPDMSSPLN